MAEHLKQEAVAFGFATMVELDWLERYLEIPDTVPVDTDYDYYYRLASLKVEYNINYKFGSIV